MLQDLMLWRMYCGLLDDGFGIAKPCKCVESSFHNLVSSSEVIVDEDSIAKGRDGDVWRGKEDPPARRQSLVKRVFRRRGGN